MTGAAFRMTSTPRTAAGSGCRSSVRSSRASCAALSTSVRGDESGTEAVLVFPARAPLNVRLSGSQRVVSHSPEA